MKEDKYYVIPDSSARLHWKMKLKRFSNEEYYIVKNTKVDVTSANVHKVHITVASEKQINDIKAILECRLEEDRPSKIGGSKYGMNMNALNCYKAFLEKLLPLHEDIPVYNKPIDRGKSIFEREWNETIYYVSNKGKNTYKGTDINKPLKNMEAAFKKALLGDVIVVLDEVKQIPNKYGWETNIRKQHKVTVEYCK